MRTAFFTSHIDGKILLQKLTEQIAHRCGGKFRAAVFIQNARAVVAAWFTANIRAFGTVGAGIEHLPQGKTADPLFGENCPDGFSHIIPLEFFRPLRPDQIMTAVEGADTDFADDHRFIPQIGAAGKLSELLYIRGNTGFRESVTVAVAEPPGVQVHGNNIDKIQTAVSYSTAGGKGDQP